MSFPKEKEDLMREHLKKLDMTTLDAVLWLSYAFYSYIMAIEVPDKKLHEKLKEIIDKSFTENTTLDSDALILVALLITTPLVTGALHEPT